MRDEWGGVTMEPVAEDLAAFVRAHWIERWGGETMATRGRLLRPEEVTGAFVAREAGEVLGVATYRVEGDACEVTSIEAFTPGTGVGTALLGAVREAAREARCHRLWLITTNDNIDALAFYQKRGLRLVALYPGAVEEARRTRKPGIPVTGAHGLPLRDEIELEERLG